MRDELFKYLVAFGHDLCYWEKYKVSARRVGNIYSGCLLFASAASIASWSIWNSYAVIWTLITMASQVLQALKPLMQSDRQRQALIYITQDATALFDELSDYWNKVGRYDPPRATDEEIQDKIMDFKRRRKAITERFAANIDFPDKEKLKQLAKRENEQYFWYYFNVHSEEEEDYVTA